MKKITLSICTAFLSLSLYAQQAEVNAAVSAFNEKDYAKTLTATDKAEKLLETKHGAEPASIAKMYYSAGKAAQSSGDMAMAAKYFAKLKQVETEPYYQAKNKSTKKNEFFLTKKEAEKVTSAGNYSSLKEKKLTPEYYTKIAANLNEQENKALKEANDAFKAKSYDTAYSKFLEAYYLSQAVGNENQLYAYYAAVAALQTEQKSNAIALLQELTDKGFTGVQTRYIAKVKDTGKEAAFANKKDMDMQVKLGLYTDPREEKTDSLEEELYSNLTYAYYTTEDYDKGISAAKKGLDKYPENKNMDQMLSSMYYKSGKLTEFISELQKKVDSGTASAADYFNLGKMKEDNGADAKEVQTYYKKAIEKDPDFEAAYLNLALSITAPEKEYVELMNQNLGSSSKEQKIYKENAAKRKVLYKEALPYLEKSYELSPDNVSLIKVLENAYDVLGDDDKFMEMKEKLKNMK